MVGTCSIDEMVGRTQKHESQLSQSHAGYFKSHIVLLGLKYFLCNEKPNTTHQKYDIVMVMSASTKTVTIYREEIITL